MQKNTSPGMAAPIFPCCLLVAAIFSPLHAAPAESPFGAGASTSPYGQIRTRSEIDKKRVVDNSANEALMHTHLRSRLGFTASPAPIGVKFEMQDTRFFGSEPGTPQNPATSTVGNMKGLDLLQGYATLQFMDLQMALGRQKMSLGAGRFLSTLEWHPYSRAFDGLSFNYAMGAGDLTGLGFMVRDENPQLTRGTNILSGLYYTHKIAPSLTADLFGFYDKSQIGSNVAGVNAINSDLVYVGQRVAGRFGPVTFEEEFIWQGGELYTTESLASAAFQLALRLGGVVGMHKFNAGLDMLSGDDDATDSDMNTYRANYFFGHAYFGWMDYFLVNPRYGVIDYRIDADLGFLPNAAGAPRVSLKPQYHFFMPASAPSQDDEPYGQEIDLEIHVTAIPKTNFIFGAGLFIPGKSAHFLPAANTTVGADNAPGYFFYFMPVVNF